MAAEFPKHPFLLTAEETAQALGTDLDKGLTSAQVAELQAKYPKNELDVGGSVPAYKIFTKQLLNAMIIVSEKPSSSNFPPNASRGTEADSARLGCDAILCLRLGVLFAEAVGIGVLQADENRTQRMRRTSTWCLTASHTHPTFSVLLSSGTDVQWANRPVSS
jgi:hypothetical protein